VRPITAEVVERQGDPLTGRDADAPRADGVQRRRVERHVVDDEPGVGRQRDGRPRRTLRLVVGDH